MPPATNTDINSHYASEARRALITSIASLCLSPILLILGFWINNSLQSPKLSIEYVDQDLQIEEAVVPKTTLDTLNRDKHASFIVRSSTPISAIDFSWMDGKPIDPKNLLVSRNYLEAAIAGIEDCFDTTSKNQALIEGWDQKSPISLVPNMHIMLPTTIEELKLHREKVLAQVISHRRIHEGELMSLKPLVDSFRKLSSEARNRTGLARIRVGVLNAGETDGVVFARDAKLRFKDYELSLQSVDYTVVKAHAFAEARFEIDVVNSLPKALDSWKDLVKSGTQEKFSVVISTGKKVLTRQTVLPPISRP